MVSTLSHIAFPIHAVALHAVGSVACDCRQDTVDRPDFQRQWRLLKHQKGFCPCLIQSRCGQIGLRRVTLNASVDAEVPRQGEQIILAEDCVRRSALFVQDDLCQRAREPDDLSIKSRVRKHIIYSVDSPWYIRVCSSRPSLTS
jgi:hypothetical protein